MTINRCGQLFFPSVAAYQFLLFPKELAYLYNEGIMLLRHLAGIDKNGLNSLDPVDLFQLCASNRENSEAWSEFLRRYAIKLRFFIRGTLRQVLGYSEDSGFAITSSGIQEGDLFQNAIVRLVENDCAAMKRFSGTSENELLAYIAVICRSTVMDTLRRNNALKRRSPAIGPDESVAGSDSYHRPLESPRFERIILARELVSLISQTIKSHSGDVTNRDKLVFKLHFLDGLSYSQIAQCGGINLSKAGVEKLLKRLVERVQTIALSGKSEEALQ
jgi:RNA polymerase sigma factor (sigma-70 family)